MYSEKFTGSRLNRPRLQEGDTLVITKLDRLARNIVEGTEIVKELFSKGGSVHYPEEITKVSNTTVRKIVLEYIHY
ncbi:hypothetical protein COL95_26040 [Bacillus anthracis]|nr:hypothetical protein COL95_26040 [Bacillus anthracis]